MFNKQEILYLTELGLKCDFRNLSEDDLFAIEETVAHRLQYSGFDENYNITKEGKICELILDKLS